MDRAVIDRLNDLGQALVSGMQLYAADSVLRHRDLFTEIETKRARDLVAEAMSTVELQRDGEG